MNTIVRNGKNNPQVKEDIAKIQYYIGQHLNSSKERPCVSFYMDINNATSRYFKSEGLNYSKFIECSEFLELFEFRTLSKHNTDDDYKQIKVNSFEMKLIKPKSTVMTSLNDTVTEFEGGWRLSVRFTKEDQINLTEEQREILNEY